MPAALHTPQEVRAAPLARGRRCVCALAIVALPLLALLQLARLLGGIGAADWVSLLAGLALGVLAADLASGLVHWACDSWGDEGTPWLGDALLRAFREHHRAPRAMLDHDWIEVNGETALASALCLLGMTLPAGQAALAGRPLLHAFLWSLACSGALSNWSHRWAHTASPPRWVRRLQRADLILSPRRHARHHRGPHTSAYCILTGWCNGWLDAWGFWRVLERCVSVLTGVEPRAAGQRRIRSDEWEGT